MNARRHSATLAEIADPGYPLGKLFLIQLPRGLAVVGQGVEGSPMIRCTSVVLIMSALLAVLCVTPSGAESKWYGYHLDRKQPLTLDPARIALLQSPKQTRTDVVAQAARRKSLDATNLQAWPIEGWWIASTAEAVRSASGIEETLETLAGENAFSFVSPVFLGDGGGPIIITPEILVGFHDGVSSAGAESILGGATAATIVDRHWANMRGVYRLRHASRNGFEVLAAANALAERPEVRFAEPDVIFTGRSTLMPNDPGFTGDYLWGLHNTFEDVDLDAPEAWNLTTGDASVLVAVIDTGVQQNHPDLHLTAGTDTTDDGPGNGGPVNEFDNHGTMVAGCISAIINNALGTVGIAPGCRVASIRAMKAQNAEGAWSTKTSWTVNAFSWAQSQGARITNNSNGYDISSSFTNAVTQKYNETRANGMVHFSSAGNEGVAVLPFPANISSVNAVGAVDPSGGHSFFSNTGEEMAFAAPGVSIYTTDRTGGDGLGLGDYATSAGTSFSSPYTAGVAALLLSYKPSLTADQVEEAMQQSCVDLGQPGRDSYFGWGLVNAYSALLTIADPTPTPTPSDTPTLSGSTEAFLLSVYWQQQREALPTPLNPADFDQINREDDSVIDWNDVYEGIQERNSE